MDRLRAVRFKVPLVFLEATKQLDDGLMNFCMGSIYDYLAASEPDHAASAIYLQAVYLGDDLLSSPGSWLSRAARNPSELLPIATSLLAEHTWAHVVDPAALQSLIGPEDAVEAFLSTRLGQRARINRIHSSPLHTSYASRSSLPPPSPTPPSFITVRATADDMPTLAPLYTRPSRPNSPTDAAITLLQRPVASRLAWLYRVHGAPAGYVLCGPVTPRSIATSATSTARLEHRRKGIAEGMARAITRYYLGVHVHQPHGAQLELERVPLGPPEVGIQGLSESLNVAERDVERVYKRAGFLIGDVPSGGLDPVSGRKAWHSLVIRRVEREHEPSDLSFA